MSSNGKQRIIDAAKRVIKKCGISGTTMRVIAEEAGLSTGAIYHYYASKEAVMYDVMHTGLSESTRIAKESHSDKRNKEAIIDEIHRNIIRRFEKDDENMLQFYLAHEAMMGNQELRIRFREKYKEWIERTEELMLNLYDKPATKYNKAFASLLIGAIDGVVLQQLIHSNAAEITEITEVYEKILRVGIPKFLDYLSQDCDDEKGRI